jgi:hypothetical protein
MLNEFIPMTLLPELLGQSPLMVARWQRKGMFKVVMHGNRRMVLASELVGLPLARPATEKDIEAMNCGEVEKTWVSCDEASAIAGCNPATIFNRLRNGELRHKVVGRKTFFMVEEVENLKIREAHQRRGQANGQKRREEADRLCREVWPRIKPLRDEAKSFREISDILNGQGIPNPMTSKPWTAQDVARAAKRMDDLETTKTKPEQEAA